MAAMPSAIVAVAYKLLPESPRYLNVMKRHDEAIKVECRRLKFGFLFSERSVVWAEMYGENGPLEVKMVVPWVNGDCEGLSNTGIGAKHAVCSCMGL